MATAAAVSALVATASDDKCIVMKDLLNGGHGSNADEELLTYAVTNLLDSVVYSLKVAHFVLIVTKNFNTIHLHSKH